VGITASSLAASLRVRGAGGGHRGDLLDFGAEHLEAVKMRATPLARFSNFLTGSRSPKGPAIPAKLFQTSANPLIGHSGMALANCFWVANRIVPSWAAGGAPVRRDVVVGVYPHGSEADDARVKRPEEKGTRSWRTGGVPARRRHLRQWSPFGVWFQV
jgi:hypothetical protein